MSNTKKIYRSLDICKYCYAQRVLENKPKNQYEAAFALMALEFDPDDNKPYLPVLCRHEIKGWRATTKLPKECHYWLEHRIELE